LTAREHLTLFAAEFRRLRTRSTLNQTQVAERLGVRPSAVSRWETGVSVPTWENVQAIAGLFDDDPHRLWGLVTFRAKDAHALHATDDPTQNPEIAAQIEVRINRMRSRLAGIPRSMWTAYLDANDRMEDSVYDLFSKAVEPLVSRDEPENDAGDEPRQGGPRNRALPGRQHALAAR
jgi:transcriptional regulator with XRE-family HTH domain